MTDSISTARTGKGDMVWGILMLICGFLAIGLPLASGIGVAIVIGWLLLISGVWHLLFGFRSGSGIGGFLWQLLLAIVYGAVGLMILLFPFVRLACWFARPAQTNFRLLRAERFKGSPFWRDAKSPSRTGVTRETPAQGGQAVRYPGERFLRKCTDVQATRLPLQFRRGGQDRNR